MSHSLPACAQLSNGYDHYGLGESSYLSGGGMGGPFPYFPPASSISSSSSSSSSTLRSWSRPGSALMSDFPHYCTLGPGMIPSSKVPGWKVCPFTPSLSNPFLFFSYPSSIRCETFTRFALIFEMTKKKYGWLRV